MVTPRFPINRLMIVVAVVALNLAVFRGLWETRRADLLGGGLMLWLAVQLGVARAIAGRGRRRAFWLGFVGSGLVAASSLWVARAFPQSVAATAWKSYAIFIEDRAYHWIEVSMRIYGRPLLHELASLLVLVLVWSAPPLLAGLAGGLIARRAFGTARAGLAGR